MPEQTKTADDFIPLHPLEFRILMILLEGPRHGYAIVHEIEISENGARRIYPANLYRRIRDLLAKNLLKNADPPAGEADDPRRRYFLITDLGKQVAAAEADRMQILLAEALDRGLLSTSG
jgi:DNA-binding PadR family transcriptional regulator